MTLSGVLAKNTTYLTLSSLVQKGLAFWWFAYAANQLGDEVFGKYLFAVTYTSIFVIVMNFGLIPVLTREGAKDPQTLQERFDQALTLKVLLTIGSVIALLVIFHVLNYFDPMPTYTVQLVYLAIGIIVFDTFRSIVFAVLRAQQLMQYEALGQVFYQVAVVGVALILFGLQMEAVGLIIAINAASLLYLLYAVFILITKTTVRFHWNWNWSLLRKLLIISTPFALADVFFKLNGSLDTVMLSYLGGDRYVTWYNIALKLTITLTVIPGAFATAFYPAMSQAVTKSKEALRDIFEQSFINLVIISLPISIGTIVLAAGIIQAAFPAFPAAIPALQWMMTSLVFLFVNYPIGNALNAANKQLLNTANMGIALAVNIALNIILIPSYTYIGAAIAAALSTMVLVGIGLPHVYQLTAFRWRLLVTKMILTAVAAGVMGGVIWWLTQLLPDTKMMLLVELVVGMVVYAVACVLVRAVRISELKQLWSTLRFSRS